jgi:triosephosphate isomerase
MFEGGLMKKIYLNLKRFDVPKSLGGVNHLGVGSLWVEKIIGQWENFLDFDYTIFFPEAYLQEAGKYAKKVKIGCQAVHFQDIEKGVNFGAFTSFRTAKSMQALGVKATVIGHCEERSGKQYLIDLGGGKGDVNLVLNQEVKLAINANLEVLYCVGEKAEEQDKRYEVLKKQIEIGLKDVDFKKITIAYEPLWAIGVGKTPPSREYLIDIFRYLKSIVSCPIVYGGGLKEENAASFGSIPEIDGGLIALTRFGQDFGLYPEDLRKIVEKFGG